MSDVKASVKQALAGISLYRAQLNGGDGVTIVYNPRTIAEMAIDRLEELANLILDMDVSA